MFSQKWWLYYICTVCYFGNFYVICSHTLKSQIIRCIPARFLYVFTYSGTIWQNCFGKPLINFEVRFLVYALLYLCNCYVIFMQKVRSFKHTDWTTNDLKHKILLLTSTLRCRCFWILVQINSHDFSSYRSVNCLMQVNHIVLYKPIILLYSPFKPCVQNRLNFIPSAIIQIEPRYIYHTYLYSTWYEPITDHKGVGGNAFFTQWSPTSRKWQGLGPLGLLLARPHGPVTHGLIGPSPARGRASPGRGGGRTGPRRLGGTGPTCGGGGGEVSSSRDLPILEDFLRTVEQRRRLRTEEWGGVRRNSHQNSSSKQYFYSCL